MDVSVMTVSQQWDVDERVERGLSSFIKKFEEGLLGERSGPVFGCWGSFLPMYKIPQTPYRIQQNPRHSMPHIQRNKSESSTPVRCYRDGSVTALPVETHGIAKRPTLLPGEGAKAAGQTLLPREEAKVADQTLLPKVGAKAAGQEEAKVADQTLLPRMGAKTADLLLPREGAKAFLLPREGAKAESGSGSLKKMVPIDQLLDDILIQKKQYKLRIVFGSEKGMEKKAGGGEGEGDKNCKVADFSSTKPPAGISNKKIFSDTVPRTPKVAETSSRKQPAEIFKKRKVSHTAPHTPKVAGAPSRKTPTRAKRSKIWGTVKRMNYKHCPEAYVGAKIHRLGRQY